MPVLFLLGVESPREELALQRAFFLVGGIALDGKPSVVAELLLPCLMSPGTCWGLYPVALVHGLGSPSWSLWLGVSLGDLKSCSA